MNNRRREFEGLISPHIGDITEADREINEEVTEEVVDLYDQVATSEDPSIRAARKETKEFLKEEAAKIKALQKIYGQTKDFARKVHYKNGGETLVIQISDWHLGKVIKDERGKVIYDSQIAAKLMAEVFAERIVKLIKRVGAHTAIDEVVILLLGDLIENEIIYDTQVHHIDLSVVQQKKEAVIALLKFIGAVEEAFHQMGSKNIPIRIEGVRGNHGRTGSYTSEESSWDISIMDELDLVFTVMKKKNISVDYSLANHKNIMVRGHRGLLRHHAPVQAESNAARGKFGGWHEMFDYDFMAFGHFHHWGMFSFNGIPIFRNGSICGTDNLAVELAVRDRPSQLIYGITEKECPTFMYKVNLD